MGDAVLEDAPKQKSDIPSVVAGFDKLPDTARVRADVVAALLGGVSDTTLWRWERAGHIPPSQRRGRIRTWSAGAIRKTLAAEAETA